MRIYLALLLLAGCTKIRPCKSQTVFLSIHLDDAASMADTLSFTVTLDGHSGGTQDVNHSAGTTEDTVEIDFPNGYTPGSSLEVQIDARAGVGLVGSGMGSTMLMSGCTTLDVKVTGTNGGDAATPPDQTMLPAHCSNSMIDADESDVDCGGRDCLGCPDGELCTGGNDCASGYCSTARKCLSKSCFDGVISGMETDVDCGGPACGACALGRMCMAGRDCQSGFCNVSMNMCVMSGCLDGAKSGNETDIDCGGINCPPCGNGLGCRVGTDCMSKYCYGTTCWPTSSSCVGLTANCGATNNQSCCSNALVPGATFYRSYDVAGDANSGNMNFPATVSDFVLDRYEVTVGRFRAFVNAGVGTAASPPPAGAGARILNSTAAQGGWDPSWSANLPATTAALTSSLLCDGVYQTWTGVAGANEDKPINCISWYEAFAFCVWDGGFLPTEAEWNYAASGGTDQRAFPWGTSLVNDCTYSNSEVDAGIFCVNGANNVGSESPKGDGRWTQSDLTGNVVEWVLDWDNNYPAPCSNCANLTPGTLRVLRGGSFADTGAALRTGYRFGAMPTTGAAHYGIRCARAK